MAEFREQDSYIDSDYDTDPSTGPNQNPCARPSTPPLSNSIIAHVELLVRAAQAYPRPRGFRPPRVKYVLNRLQECPEGGHQDVRIPVTFSAVKELGASLVLGARQGPLPERKELIEAVPTARILLDLSVVVALCCESTHMALPTTNQELEARFRPLQLSADGTLELAPHTNVSKDLRDQLDWESRHPLILEIQQRLSAALGEDGGPLEFWVTKEVKDRLPAIVDLIGGDIEKARAKALFDGEGFWDGSRWSGRARILRDIRARVLDNERGEARDSALTSFQRGLVTVCQTMLDLVEPASNSGTPPRAASPPAIPAKVRRSKNPKRSITIFPGSRLPSSHTLRTLTAGVQNGMTVLTNNRGAISKVIREMGVTEGLPRDPIEDGKAVVWIVNPSSLSEWRRGDVEQQNRALKESLTQVAQQDST